jgi:hypothetical protein
LSEQFSEKISIARLIDFLKQYAAYYRDTEQTMLHTMLQSPFLHVDETKVNIKGENWYVWVFTDERHVIFKLTETREATLVHEGSSQGAQWEVYTLHSPLDAIQQR